LRKWLGCVGGWRNWKKSYGSASNGYGWNAIFSGRRRWVASADESLYELRSKVKRW
jgi:hypothetical protein